ncbi:FUSC family protein [Corynebacterium sp. H130]|uniref:FUSC family protein n=1 Tax=Corynebacterium sp. H130 TaxID=3133444 RepID=UPI0030B22B2F
MNAGEQHRQEKMPPAPNPWHLLTAFHTPGPRWPGALRAALAMFIPGIIALALGLDHEVVLITAGSCTVIYGEGHPFRTRWKVLAIAAALIISGTGMGALVGQVVWGHINAGDSHWWLLLTALFACAIAGVLLFISNALRLPPPGPFFIVMVASASTMTPRLSVEPWQVAMFASIGALSGFLLGMAPALIHPHKPEANAVAVLEGAIKALKESDGMNVGRRHQAETALANAWYALADARVVQGGKVIDESRRELVTRALAAQQELVRLSRGTEAGATASDSPTYVDTTRLVIPHTRPTAKFRLYRSISWHSHATVTTVRILLASLAASVVGIALGFDRPDWAIVSAVMMLQMGPDVVAGTIRGAHRLIGSIIGIGAFALIHWLDPNPLGLLCFLAMTQFMAEIFVVRNYAITVIFTTPLALLMGGATHGELAPVMISRIAETTIATFFAVAALWFVFRGADRSRHAELMERCFGAMGNLLGALTIKSPAEALAYRRDLQHELLGERGAIQSLAANNRPVAAERWQQHLQLQDTGYALLDYCSAHSDTKLSLGEIEQLAQHVRNSANARTP